MEQHDSEEKIKKKPKQNIIKRILKVLLYIILSIIGLNVFLYILLSIPYIQEKAKNFAVDELKKKLNTEIAIDELRLSLFNRVSLKGIYIEDQSKDTLLYAKYLGVNISPLELIKKKELAITSIDLDDFIINISRKDTISDFNFQFIIDGFASSDTTQKDTTKSSLSIVIKDIDLKHGQLNYNVLSIPKTPGVFNASHISLHNLEANVDIYSLDPDRFDIELNKLAVSEESGLEIKSLKAHFFSNKSLLWIDGLALSLPQSYLILDKAKYDLSSGEFSISTQNTEIDPNDLTAFLPDLQSLTDKIILKTDITGTLPAININSLSILYGNTTTLEGNVYISNYSEYDTAEIGLNINKFKITSAALASFIKIGDPTYTNPDILNTMNEIYLKGNINGQLNKFRLQAEAWAKQGCIALSAKGSFDKTFTNFNINSTLNTQNFNLGKLLGEDTGLRKLSANISLNAKQVNDKLSANVDGMIQSIGYKENTIKDIPLEAFYNPLKMGIKSNAKTSIGSIFVEASMTQTKIPDINFDVDIKDLQTNYFYKDDMWEEPRLNLCLNGHIKGLDIDNMTGEARIDSLSFIDSAFQLKPGAMVLKIEKIADNNRSITFNSSILSASIKGDCKLSTLGDEFSNMLHEYMPNIFQQGKRLKGNYNNFTFQIKANNTEQLGNIFGLPVDIIQPGTLEGRINTPDRQINIRGNMPSLKYGNFDLDNTRLNIVNIDSAFSIKLSSDLMMEEGLYNVYVAMNGANSIIQTFIDVFSDSTKTDIEGHLESLTEFSRGENNELITDFQIIPNYISIGKLKMYFTPAKIKNVGDRTIIDNLGITINDKPYFGVEGVISKEKDDKLTIYFENAQIADILGEFGINDIYAKIDGDVLLQNLTDQPELYTEGLKVSEIAIFGDTLGTVNIESLWNDKLGGVKLDASLQHNDKKTIQIGGMIYTSKDSLDLAVNLDKFPLQWAQPFVADMLNELSGNISMGLKIKGSTKIPIIEGFIGFNETLVGIDYTNVTYSISDTINIVPGKIGFNNLTVKDTKGNVATANAILTHKKMKDIKYSMNMNLNNLMVLNTENRTDSLFYGRVYASGNVQIAGNEKNMNINMQVRNGKSSKLNIVIPSTSEATNYQSVVYINVPETKIDNNQKYQPQVKRQETMPIKLNVALTVTDDLEVGVIIDPESGNSMKVNGNGIINFAYNTATENMTVFGDYLVSQGSVRINLQHISKLDFQIREGSELKFVGDPMKTTFNIDAYRRVRTSLRTLDPTLDNDMTSTKVIVDCDLGIQGNLSKMDVTYNINLPNANQNVQQQVNSLISTEEQKIRQFAYLVLTGSFYSNTGSSGANFTDGVWTNMAAGTISNVLNSAFKNILGDKWEIGTNIESNDGTFSDMDMSLNVSRRFLDDKLKVNTNVGYRTDASAAMDNALIGDFDVEYILSPTWTLKAYNKTNDQFYKQAPTTQGVGIVYTKEARSLKRLFQSFKRRKRVPEQPTSIPTDSVKQPVITEEKRKQNDSINVH